MENVTLRPSPGVYVENVTLRPTPGVYVENVTLRPTPGVVENVTLEERDIKWRT